MVGEIRDRTGRIGDAIAERAPALVGDLAGRDLVALVAEHLRVRQGLQEGQEVRALIGAEREPAHDGALIRVVATDALGRPAVYRSPSRGVVVQYRVEGREAAVVHVGRGLRDETERRGAEGDRRVGDGGAMEDGRDDLAGDRRRAGPARSRVTMAAAESIGEEEREPAARRGAEVLSAWVDARSFSRFIGAGSRNPQCRFRVPLTSR